MGHLRFKCLSSWMIDIILMATFIHQNKPSLKLIAPWTKSIAFILQMFKRTQEEKKILLVPEMNIKVKNYIHKVTLKFELTIKERWVHIHYMYICKCTTWGNFVLSRDYYSNDILYNNKVRIRIEGAKNVHDWNKELISNGMMRSQ